MSTCGSWDASLARGCKGMRQQLLLQGYTPDFLEPKLRCSWFEKQLLYHASAFHACMW